MATLIQRENDDVTFQVTVRLGGRMPEMEAAILEAVNDLGRSATEEALQRFDTDGSPIQLGAIKWTARSRDGDTYQTPYGPVRIERYIYQTSRGGRIDCPLEHQARIIRDASPRFASQLSHEYGQLNARAVQTDLEQNHGRTVATSYIQNVAEWVGGIAGAKEERWEYELPALQSAITAIVIGLDGAMIPIADSPGSREAMVGALSLYDSQDERQHTVYLAAAPEHGKAAFKQRMEREIVRIKQQFPEALSLGSADGTATNWAFLEQHTQRQLIDFHHAIEYVAKIARAAHPQAKAKAKRDLWQSEHCARLKHQPDALATLIEEATQLAERRALSRQVPEDLDSARTYFSNHRHQMDYACYVADGLRIGSGVTEAACKILVKQRLCASGMRWKNAGAKIGLSLCALTQTTGRWTQFRQRIDQFGAECCC